MAGKRSKALRVGSAAGTPADILAAEVAARTEATAAALEGSIARTKAFSRAGTRSLRRDPSGKRLYSRAARARKLAARAGIAAVVLATLLVLLPPFSWPTRGIVSSGFFLRLKPDSLDLLDLEFHKGIDIAAPRGSLVLPTAPGRVVAAGRSPTAGNYVVIRHLFGLESRYYHLDRVLLAEGQLVLVPWLSPLGSVGSTGRSTGPHLHFELDAEGKDGRSLLPLPPRALLAPHSLRLLLLGF